MMSAMPAVQPMVFATAPQAQQSNQMQQPQDIWINNNGVWCQARIISTQAPPPTFYSLLPTPLQTQVPTAPSTPTMTYQPAPQGQMQPQGQGSQGSTSSESDSDFPMA